MNKIVLSFVFIFIGCSDSEDSKENTSEVKSDPVESFKQYAEQTVKEIKLTLKKRKFILSEGNPDAKLLNVMKKYDAQIDALEGKRTVPDPEFYARSLVHIQVSDKYTIDVKETDSLISPYTGKITMQKRIVRDKLLEFEPTARHFGINWRGNFVKRVKANPDKWVTVSIDFGYQNGKWTPSRSMVQSLQGNLKPAK